MLLLSKEASPAGRMLLLREREPALLQQPELGLLFWWLLTLPAAPQDLSLSYCQPRAARHLLLYTPSPP
jgi:hypothetical protein